MPLITDTRSGFEDYFKKYRAEDEATSRWEQFLTGLREGYDVSAQAVGAQTAYDISGAYSNYLRQQRALQQSNILSETYKSQMAQGLLGQYESSFAQAQTERAQALGELQQNVLEQYQQGQEAATNWANKASQLTQALYQYGGYVDEGKDYNLQLAGYDVSEGGLGFYTQAPGSTELSLTAAGEEFYDKLLNREITRPVKGEDGGFQIRYGFADWLRNESGLEDANELADWYEQNQAQYKEALGGKRVSDAEYTPEEETEDYIRNLEETFESEYKAPQEFSTEQKKEYYDTTKPLFEDIDAMINRSGLDAYERGYIKDINSFISSKDPTITFNLTNVDAGSKWNFALYFNVEDPNQNEFKPEDFPLYDIYAKAGIDLTKAEKLDGLGEFETQVRRVRVSTDSLKKLISILAQRQN